MIIFHRGLTIELLGDPHVGRPFVRGVPLHRRGERERSVWADFEQSMSTTADLHICLGDLMDRWSVPYDIVHAVACTYREAPKTTRYFILRGNHDVSRDLERKGAFDVFKLAVEHLPHVTVVDEPMVVDGIGLVPWHPHRPAEELILPCDIAIGHWDIESVGSDNHNLIPTKRLAELGVTKAYTGHIHKPQVFTRNGVQVHVVGSLQPYGHGEEVNKALYVTRNLDQVRADPDAYRDKCLRVVLAPSELFDITVDCLQLTIKRSEGDGTQERVSMGAFNMEELFAQALAEAEVNPDIQARLLERYHAHVGA